MAVKRSKALSLTILLLFFSEFLCGIALAAEDSSSKLENVIGIDFGTTNFCVGMYRYGSVQIIPNDQGNRITRSWVGFTDTVPLVTPSWIAFKRLIGKKFNDPEVQRDIKDFPYKVVNKEGKPYIEVKFKDEAKVFSPEEISAMILSKSKETAEVFLGKNITNAVLTVPAYFNDAQRQATKDAAKIAGLSVERIISKPTAAAIAYNLDKKEKKMNVLVYDLGGTTLEVSIVTFDNGLFEVKSTNGDNHLGGQDFDGRVMEHFIKSIRENYNKDITNDKEALRKLHKKCESAKRGLSFKDQVQVEIGPLFDGGDFSEPLTREIFEDLNIDLFEKTIGSVKKALQDAELNKTDIHEIVLAGGSSRIPKVRRLLKDFFNGKEPMKGVNPDEVVAYGAAYLDGSSSGEKGREDHKEGCSCCQLYNNMWQH